MYRLHLQLALDHCTLEEAVDMAARAAPLVDTVEVGTPLLVREGVAALRQVRAQLEGHSCGLFADTKISDEGPAIARVCFEAGADAVSVVDGARTNLLGVRAIASEFGNKEVWVDLLNDANPIIRARALAPLVDGFIIHRPESGLPRLLVEGLLAVDRPLRLAGGITLGRARRALQIHYAVPWRQTSMGAMEGIIVGRAITEAPDFDAALRAFADLCHPEDNRRPTTAHD
jgi:3-hexulose-6-phosphate synthase